MLTIARLYELGRDHKLTSRELTVLGALASLADEAGEVVAPKARVAEVARVDRGDALPRAIAGLVEKGLVRFVEPQHWAILCWNTDSVGIPTSENPQAVGEPTSEDRQCGNTDVGEPTGLADAPSVARSKDTSKGTSRNDEGTLVYTRYPAGNLEGTGDEKEPQGDLVLLSRPFVTQEPPTDPEGTPEDTVEYWVHPGPDGLPVTMEEWLRVQEVYRLWKAEDTYYLEHGGAEPATLWQTFKASNLDRWRSYRDIRNCREGRAPARVDPPEPGRAFPWAGQERALYAKWERSGGRESWEDWRDKVLMEDFALAPDNDINQFLWTTTLENRRRLLRGT